MLLRAEGISKVYSGRRVVDNVSVDVKPGEVVGLLGPNGAGKTTSFYMIVGLERPSEGKIFISDEDVTEMAVHERARSGISYLAQESSVFQKLTVKENLMLILELMDIPEEEKENRAQRLLEEFNVADLAESKGSQLSGGERRRVEIARALVTNPHFILLDEPFAGVDPISVLDIQSIIKQLKERGIGVLITDHNVRETLAITDRTYLMNNGQIILSGTSEEIAENEEAKKFYLGDSFSL